MKVIAFDVFGTVFDMSGVPAHEVREYVAHVRKYDWSPLTLPASWERLPPHSDAAEGIERLRTRYRVATCSNGPLETLARLSRNAGIEWDAIVPLEARRTFKPHPQAYLTAAMVCCVEPADVTLVTANETFGDLEGAPKAGMAAVLIDRAGVHEGKPRTIVELAESLGC